MFTVVLLVWSTDRYLCLQKPTTMTSWNNSRSPSQMASVDMAYLMPSTRPKMAIQKIN